MEQDTLQNRYIIIIVIIIIPIIVLVIIVITLFICMLNIFRNFVSNIGEASFWLLAFN